MTSLNSFPQMDWTRGHTIGHGSSAVVSTATLRPSGEIMAVKSVELSRSETLRKEHIILSTLNHPNIVDYKGCDISRENDAFFFNLLMEYAPEGTIADAIRRRGDRLDEPTLSHYTCGIIKGLVYLHSKGVAHCDIKGSNILLTRGGPKLADFGCAKTVVDETISGTPMFMAPEAARGEEQSFSADIWAVGCTIIEMFTGNPPWPDSASALSRIAFSGEPPEFPILLSDLAKDFLGKCLRFEPRERWTAGQLLEHPFLDESRFGVPVKEIRDDTCSPTSVLDEGIWRSTEGDFREGVSEVHLGGFLDRMKELCVNSGRDDWEWGERWITVRQ